MGSTLTGTAALVTGASSGIGAATARQLADHGAAVALVARRLSSGMQKDADASLRDIDWTARSWNGVQAYCDSKLFITALAFAVGRRWPDLRAHAVDPGWVPTSMGGPGAPDDLELGYLTQSWLTVCDHPEATGSGGYWYHQRRRSPAPAALDESFQDALVDELFRLTDVRLP